MPEHETAIENADLIPEGPGLHAQRDKTGAHEVRNAIIPVVIDGSDQAIDTPAPHWRDDPELGQMRPDRVLAAVN